MKGLKSIIGGQLLLKCELYGEEETQEVIVDFCPFCGEKAND